MAFKRKNISVKKRCNLFTNFVWTVSIFIVFLIWVFLVKAVSNLDFWDIDSPSAEKVEITDDEVNLEENSNLINILIVGRWWWNHDAPDLTDTIILASIDAEKSIATMLSIPRDIYVEYEDWTEWKINEVYIKALEKYESEELWMKALKEKITQMTWQKIDFYVNVDFKWFIEIVDAFWWVEVEIPEPFIDNEYPDWKLGYTTFVLKQWKRTLDWEVALKYVRSRHSTSDFDRSIRQQQVLKSLKDKIISWEFLKNANNIKKLYEILSNHVKTDISLKNTLKLNSFRKSIENLKILSFNLNDSCFYGTDLCMPGWVLYIPERGYFWWASVLLPYWTEKWKLNNYESLQKFTDLIFNSREIYIEKPKINVFNSLKVNFLASETADMFKKYWFNVPDYNSIWNTWEKYENSIIYYNWIEENSETIKSLRKFFSWKIEKKDKMVFAKEEDVKIEVVIWEDYKSVFNF